MLGIIEGEVTPAGGGDVAVAVSAAQTPRASGHISDATVGGCMHMTCPGAGHWRVGRLRFWYRWAGACT
eukprot:361502-Chlamydomonas_euryale.AAC.2